MLIANNLTKWMISALILIGALVACSPLQTPLPVATATVIASTATVTATPSTATTTPLPSTAIILSTEVNNTITTIFDISVALDFDFSQEIIIALANHLEIPSNRIQMVSVEVAEWDSDTLGCQQVTSNFDGVTISSSISDNRVVGLRYILLLGDTLYEYHTEGTERFLRCQGQTIVSGEVLVAVDPLAAETLRVVQSLLATELDLSSRRVQLVDMIPVTWTDTSLGCPQAEQTYTQIEIPGYHIVVTVGNDLYIYHSDANTAYACPLEQSIIPAN